MLDVRLGANGNYMTSNLGSGKLCILKGLGALLICSSGWYTWSIAIIMLQMWMSFHPVIGLVQLIWICPEDWNVMSLIMRVNVTNKYANILIYAFIAMIVCQTGQFSTTVGFRQPWSLRRQCTPPRIARSDSEWLYTRNPRFSHQQH
jgi:hypothetical protein